MPQWRGYLERFRPAGTPGAAARSAVPADRTADAVAELTPLLALLDGVQDEADRIRRDAADRAEKIRQAARRRAEEIRAHARLQAQSVQAEAEARIRARAGAEMADLRGETAAEIQRVHAKAAEGMPDLVTEVASLSREWLGESPQHATAVMEQ